MSILIEIILLAVIVLGMIVGFKSGFVKMAARPVKLILALLIAFSFCEGFADAVIVPMIDAPVSGYVTDFLYENCASISAENAETELPTLLKLAAGISGVDISEAAGTGDVIANLTDALISPVIRIVAVIISFIAVYLISRIVLFVLFLLIGFSLRDGIFGGLNKLLGFAFALVISVTLAWGLAVISELVFHTPALADNAMFSQFEGGPLYRLFNEYNPMELLLSF